MTDKYAVIGNPIAHSKSPLIHTAFAKQTGQDISYERILAPLDGFAAMVRELIAQGYKGVNVTVPFKFEALSYCREHGLVNPLAASAGAVNTIIFKANGGVVGDNTDGIGLVTDITQNLQILIQDKRVLLMGAGGAAYGVVLPLLKAGALLFVANRTPEKAEQLASVFNQMQQSNVVIARNYTELKDEAFDIVINASSIGFTDDLPPISGANFAENGLAYDMMYSRETQFKKLADENRSKGVMFADGLGMLVEQAAEAFFVWRGVRPETQSVMRAIRNLPVS